VNSILDDTLGSQKFLVTQKLPKSKSADLLNPLTCADPTENSNKENLTSPDWWQTAMGEDGRSAGSHTLSRY